MKRIISAGLCTAFILSLAGCARQDTTPSLTAADTTDTQMGRWVESRVDLGGEQLISYPTQLADGTIVLYTGKVGEDSIEDYTRRTSTDGTNWTSEPAAFDVGDAMVTWILVAPGGEQALITYDGENAGLVLQAPDGTKTVVEDDTVKQGINPNTAVFQGDKLDFVSNGGTVDFVQVSLTDGSVTTAALPQDLAYSLNSLTTVGNQLVYLSFDNNTGDIILNALDPATGASTELLNPVPNATSSQALTGDADGAAYYACTDGIYRLAPGGTLPEQVVPAEGTAMSISSNYPLSLLRTAAEDFMVLLFGDSGGNGDLYFYHYDETLPTHADTTLTVWSLADSATARLAVNAYKKANPEVDVTFETAVQTDTDDVSAAINDALTQLNTELLAGEGPDVLLLDRVDYTTYINKGMLADMSDTVPLDALQSNIIDPFMTDGRAYVLPARFIVPALCGDAGTLDGLTDLNDLQDAVLAAAPRPDTEQYSDEYYTALPDDQKYALALASGVDFAKLLLPSSANALLHDGALDADALTKIFTFVKTTADTTLTVWSLADSATARLAVNAYKKANPEVDVTFETAVQTDTDDVSAAINDALTQLNTELLAGEGPDVLLLDRVDYTTYINKGMLADMSDTVPLDALQSNIIDPFMTDGRAYVLPARFIVPALCGDAGTLDGLTDLNDLQDAVLAAAPRPDTEQYSDEYYTALPDDQKYALALASGVDFAKLLLPSSANALLHDGALDADALTKIFTFVKTTADYYGMADYINTEMDGASSQSYDNADIVKIDAQQDEYSTCSRAKFGWMDVATPYAVIAMARTNDIFDADAEAVPVDMIPMPGLTQGAYNPQVLVGVNANSKNPDAAKGLAAAFFGTDVQSQYCSDGTTVRADCLREKLDAVKATVSGAKTGKVTGAYVGDLDAFYANCTTPVLFPVMLQQSFINHAKAIIDGSEDVAAAVAGVQSDLALYLAEQK